MQENYSVRFMLSIPCFLLPNPSLEKLLYLGRPQDRIFRYSLTPTNFLNQPLVHFRGE